MNKIKGCGYFNQTQEEEEATGDGAEEGEEGKEDEATEEVATAEEAKPGETKDVEVRKADLSIKGMRSHTHIYSHT